MRRRVLAWFKDSGRDFPWRRAQDPYDILIAELLLQRTRADLVLPLYESFLNRYPNASALAAATPQEVTEFLRPLGFAHRSARLPALGRVLRDCHRGRIPRDLASLLRLPGVGRYVANAVLVLAFGQREPLLDPNVIRLLSRVYALTSERTRPRDDIMLWNTLRALTPRTSAREFGLALIDLGAVVCLRRRPRCRDCPLKPRCRAYQEGLVIPDKSEKAI